jgi:hypothetical protein
MDLSTSDKSKTCALTMNTIFILNNNNTNIIISTFTSFMKLVSESEDVLRHPSKKWRDLSQVSRLFPSNVQLLLHDDTPARQDQSVHPASNGEGRNRLRPSQLELTISSQLTVSIH